MAFVLSAMLQVYKLVLAPDLGVQPLRLITYRAYQSIQVYPTINLRILAVYPRRWHVRGSGER